MNKNAVTPKRKVIGVDMDGVCTRLDKKWINTYNVIFNDTLKVDDIKSWDIEKYVKPEAKDYIKNILNLHKFYRDLEAIEGCQRVLERLAKDYDIIIVTDPFTRMSYKSKHDWLQEKFPFIPSRNYVFTGNKSIIKADYLIDDGIHNLRGFTGTPILFSAPNNMDNEEFFRVLNWQDVEHTFYHKLHEVETFYNPKLKSTAI